MTDSPVTICDFGENRGHPHQPFNPVPPLYNPTVCNYCGRKLVLMGTVWAVDLTPEYYAAENERLRKHLGQARRILLRLWGDPEDCHACGNSNEPCLVHGNIDVMNWLDSDAELFPRPAKPTP